MAYECDYWFEEFRVIEESADVDGSQDPGAV
jgi:hypothetical protein